MTGNTPPSATDSTDSPPPSLLEEVGLKFIEMCVSFKMVEKYGKGEWAYRITPSFWDVICSNSQKMSAGLALNYAVLAYCEGASVLEMATMSSTLLAMIEARLPEVATAIRKDLLLEHDSIPPHAKFLDQHNIHTTRDLLSALEKEAALK